MRSGVLTGNDTGGAAQLAAAHGPNERTLDPAVSSQTDPTMPQPATLWPSPRNVLTIFSNELPDTNCYSFTYPGDMEG